MKLISLNIAIKIDNSQKVVDFLLEQNADIVCLQEVASHKEDSVEEMLKTKDYLDRGLSEIYPYRFFSPLFQTKEFSQLKLGGFVEQGNYILSKFPILKASTDFYHKTYQKVEEWKAMNFREEDHGRALQTVELDCNGQALRVMNIHGSWTPDKMGNERTRKQIDFICGKIRENGLPTILAGDLNLLPESESIQPINKELRNLVLEGQHGVTRPDFNDGLDEGSNIVDYIFINDKIINKSFEVIKNSVSDHYPLAIEFNVIREAK